MKQWHPLFAKLLRPLLEDYYQVETEVPVGDAPRQADLVLLRRTSAAEPPFQGLWKNLTTWNILEYKGPTVSARLEDLPLLIELGLGIHRRLNEERNKKHESPVPRTEVSFWYLANFLGKRFLAEAGTDLEDLEAVDNGLWRCRILQHLVYLVSCRGVPVDLDSLPLHVLGQESPETKLAAAKLVIQNQTLWELFGQTFASLHPEALEELQNMSKTLSRGPQLNLQPFVDWFGIEEVLKQVEKVIQRVGLEKFIQQVGTKKVIEQIGVDRLLANLTPAQRREMKKRLQ
jgi:hypothetical protein